MGVSNHWTVIWTGMVEWTMEYGMDYRICVQQTAPLHTVFWLPLSPSTLSVLRIAGLPHVANAENPDVLPHLNLTIEYQSLKK